MRSDPAPSVARISACGAGDSIKPGVERSGTPGPGRSGGPPQLLRHSHPASQARGASGSRGNIPDSYTNLLYHLVFSTKERRPLITPDKEIRLYEYMGGIVRELGGISLEVNGTEDHFHQLAKPRPDKAVSDVLRDLKSNATGWMHDVFPSLKNFSWQRGYGAFTVSQSNVEDVRNYIRRQKEHHRKISAREEFIQFLKANEIKYDERYL